MEPTGATACPNCGEPRPGRYCPECGQRQGERIASLGAIIREALDDQLSINSTLPRTIGALLARPGHLTSEYMRGRIMRYVPPFRLYLVTSIIFFLLVSIASQLRPQSLITVSGGPPPPDAPLVQSGIERPVRFTRGAPGFFGIDIATDTTVSDSITVAVNLGNETLNRRVEARVAELAHLPPDEIVRTVLPDVIERIPTAMFVLLPLFAGLLHLLYLRQKRYYVEHFVFALHTHAFTYLTFTLMFTLQATFLPAVLMLWVMIYYWLAMRRVYGQGVIVTTFKYWFLFVVYGLLLTVVLVVAILLALLLG